MVAHPTTEPVLHGFPTVGMILGLCAGLTLIPISSALDATEEDRYSWVIAFGIAAILIAGGIALAKRMPAHGLTFQGFALGIATSLTCVTVFV